MRNPVGIVLACSFWLAIAGCAAQPAADHGRSQTKSDSPDTASGAIATAAATSGTDPQPSGEPVAPARDAAGFEAWVDAFRRRAAARGVSARTLAAAFEPAEFRPRVIALDRRQPEFTRAIWTYLDSAVSDARIREGREQLAARINTGRAVQARYGVPPNVIGAIWGVESNYGRNFGNYETIDALATLGYDGRRQAFAEEQLYAALEILASGDIDRARMRGSWAGAMGHTQFLPTSFIAYAVDADGDGRRDIWNSIVDVMGSTANYLQDHGWQRGSPWGREVVLPSDFDYANAHMDTRRRTTEWAARGVTAVDTRGLPHFKAGAIIAPAGAHGPAFLVGPNFRVILRYNNATSYALAVGLLSDRLAGAPGVQGDWPRTLASLSHADVREMQARLNALGYASGTPDGIVGPKTRGGLRAFQDDRGMSADGYPTYALLRRIRAASRTTQNP